MDQPGLNVKHVQRVLQSSIGKPILHVIAVVHCTRPIALLFRGQVSRLSGSAAVEKSQVAGGKNIIMLSEVVFEGYVREEVVTRSLHCHWAPELLAVAQNADRALCVCTSVEPFNDGELLADGRQDEQVMSMQSNASRHFPRS
eukprot:185777-Amphidinium_carterae.1